MYNFRERERERVKRRKHKGVLCACACVFVFVAGPKIVQRTDAPPKSEDGSSSEVNRPSHRRVLINWSDNKVKLVRDCPALCWSCRIEKKICAILAIPLWNWSSVNVWTLLDHNSKLEIGHNYPSASASVQSVLSVHSSLCIDNGPAWLSAFGCFSSWRRPKKVGLNSSCNPLFCIMGFCFYKVYAPTSSYYL